MNSKFDAYRIAIELVKALRALLAELKLHDRNLADQAQRAATSIVLNIAEGNRRAGRDRLQLFRVALGSADEVGAALDVAVAWGFLAEEPTGPVLALLDRQRAVLWRLMHRREG